MSANRRRRHERMREPERLSTEARKLLARAECENFRVEELARALAAELGCEPATAARRIYRAVERGQITAIRYFGALRITRGEAERVLFGETY